MLTSFRDIHRAKTKAFFRRFLAAASFATASAALSAHAAPGDLYATDSSSGSSTAIVKFTPQGVKTTFASGLSLVLGLAFDSSGNLFATQSSNMQNGDTVLKFTPDGTKSTFASGLNELLGLAFDSSGNLFVAESGTGKLLKFTPSGAQSTFAILNFPTALAFDFSGNLFVGDASSILKFTPTGSETTFTSESREPKGLAFDGSGNLFETDQGSPPSSNSREPEGRVPSRHPGCSALQAWPLTTQTIYSSRILTREASSNSRQAEQRVLLSPR